ncbi:hypothetical protein BKA62DRAFT_672571 [Auriculariales sp. MPI-PUGE-AT-0066]|nr:hypothetical protein BKA62DRAFT_672571 [Auriculariales sp. MPI-PUGE-AT-0066]
MLPHYGSTTIRPPGPYTSRNLSQTLSPSRPPPGSHFLCSPYRVDVSIQLGEPPSLRMVSCTSCGASGDGPLQLHKSNFTKWGASFLWLYCVQCTSAFGTFKNGLLQTYRSTPKDNSTTGRLIRVQSEPMVPFGQILPPSNRVNPQMVPRRSIGNPAQTAIPPSSPAKSSHPAPTTPATPSSTMSTQKSRFYVSPASREPFMNVRMPAGDSSTASTPSGKVTADGTGGDSSDEDLSPGKITPTRGRREIQINIQMQVRPIANSTAAGKQLNARRQNLEVHCLPMLTSGSTLKWNDLPQLIRDHLQSSQSRRALELIPRPGASWQPFGFASVVAINPRAEIMFARVVSSTPMSPHEIIVLEDSDSDVKQVSEEDDDEEEKDEPPAKRRRITPKKSRVRRASESSG